MHAAITILGLSSMVLAVLLSGPDSPPRQHAIAGGLVLVGLACFGVSCTFA